MKEKRSNKSSEETSTSASSTVFSIKSNTNSLTSSLNYQRELSEYDRTILQERHKKLNNKWELRSGRSVEDVIYEEAKNYECEHSYHSYIISLDDDNLYKIFTEEEIEELVAGSGKDDLNKILKKWKKMDLENAFLPLRFSRIDSPVEHWLVKSILDYAEMFSETNSVRTFGSEATLLDEMYNFIKDSKKISNAATEFTAGSESSCNSKNVKRNLSGIEKIARKIPGDIPDLAFKYGDNELGCVEIGLSNGCANGTKELNEKMIKTLKMMRNDCWKIMNDYEISSSPKDIKVVSYVISGPYLTTSIMTFKHGSVGLVYSCSSTKMPTIIKEISRLLSRAIQQCYNASQVIKGTTEYLDRILR